MDIDGHPPIPLAQNNCPLWQFPSYFSMIFCVPNFWVCFEALNDVFGNSRGEGKMVSTDICFSQLIYIYKSNIPFQWAIERPKQRSYTKVMTPRS